MNTARLHAERRYHDEQAAARAVTFDREPGRLRFTDDEYLDHESWVRPAFARLGDVGGRRVLDWGCGHGMAAVVLARRGADVTACDLSPGYVTEARQRSRANGVVVKHLVADAEHLPFADGVFDAIWGHAILHHLDVPAAAIELRRVLRPGGVAVLCEPWGGNPLLSVARKLMRRHTEDERPLRTNDRRRLVEVFTAVEVTSHQLTGAGPLGPVIMRRIPPLGRWCRYVVIALR